MIDSEGSSPMRHLFNLGHGTEYRSFPNLADAKKSGSSWVILEGDEGGQVYAVFRVADVVCSEQTLHQLLLDIDLRYWADESATQVAFEVHQAGDGIAGGMGGGLADPAGWVHPALILDGLDQPIRHVLAGIQASIHPH